MRKRDPRSILALPGMNSAKRAEPAADIVFTPSLGDITWLQFHRSREII